MDIKWNKIKSNDDIDLLVDHFGGFYDSCLKEMKYVSGSFVSSNLSMKPIDDKKQLFLIIQRQNKNHSVIEFLFEGVERLNLVPTHEDYDSIISGILLEIKNGYIYFADNPIDIDKLEEYTNDFTYIKAKSAKWREVNQYIGDSLVYIHRDQ